MSDWRLMQLDDSVAEVIDDSAKRWQVSGGWVNDAVRISQHIRRYRLPDGRCPIPDSWVGSTIPDKLGEDWEAIRRFRQAFNEAETTLADVRRHMHWLCKLGRHKWYVASVWMTGHDSHRTWICERCQKRDLIVERKEPRAYYGGSVDEPMGEIRVRVLEPELILPGAT